MMYQLTNFPDTESVVGTRTERFTCLLYDKTMSIKKIKDLRQELFSRIANMKTIQQHKLHCTSIPREYSFRLAVLRWKTRQLHFLVTLVGERMEKVGSSFGHCFVKLQRKMPELFAWSFMYFSL